MILTANNTYMPSKPSWLSRSTTGNLIEPKYVSNKPINQKDISGTGPNDNDIKPPHRPVISYDWFREDWLDKWNNERHPNPSCNKAFCEVKCDAAAYFGVKNSCDLEEQECRQQCEKQQEDCIREEYTEYYMNNTPGDRI